MYARVATQVRSFGLGLFLARPGPGALREGPAGTVVGEAFDQAEDRALN